jgi:hypothetical protein
VIAPATHTKDAERRERFFFPFISPNRKIAHREETTVGPMQTVGYPTVNPRYAWE